MLMVTTGEVWFRYTRTLSWYRKASAALCVAAAGVMTGMRMAAGWVNTAAPAAGEYIQVFEKKD
uniref:hypothetical protein n=1 Tax=Serratia marcescens TaxID=615 RepID=UPI001F4BD264|nr:hypothetical protein [Serratia marcescens]